MQSDSALITREDIDALAKTDWDFIQVTERIRDTALALLNEESDIDTLLDRRNKAQAIGEYITRKVRAREAKLEAQNNIAEIRIRYERELGRLIQKMQAEGELNPQGRNTRTSPNTVLDDVNDHLTLSDLGITHMQSSRWQDMAVLPDEQFEAHLAEAKENGDELTSASIQKVGRNIREQARRAKAAQTPLPVGKYRCIVIDPPWPVQKIERDERPNQGMFLDYPTMSLDEIVSLPIRDLTDEDGCHLYLWTTQKFLPTALDLMKVWGFNYQCVLTWVKPTGMTPYSWMYNTELVLFGRRGDLPLSQNGLKLSFEAPVIGHSVKPDVFYQRAIAASPEPRLEMFARQRRDGFMTWGSEL